ncbi:5-hydroxytryptamine receptor 3A [Carassius gibelio]|uniref:5-hydroxytryptamine receptor 3A n=1 Tax=Carassius gibelio TaxID=101364 RepID=UPI0022793557|nr:5-hydroxytryptamine receptor 3A [Carassius gibelio]
MGLPHRISLFLLLCSSPIVFVGGASNSTEALCDRRCLANARVKQELFSAPQDDNCTMVVNITSIQYETLSFDTKGMEMSSRIKTCLVLVKYASDSGTSGLKRHTCKANSGKNQPSIASFIKRKLPSGVKSRLTDKIARMCSELRPFSVVEGKGFTNVAQELLDIGAKYGSNVQEWKDPDLGWMQEKPRFPTIVMPVDKIWIPQIVLDNAIETTVEPYTKDVQVRRDGTVSHAIVMFTTVSCQINLFNYPFVTGSCPVAINGWSQKTCALNFQISDNVTLVGGSRGEWLTTSVNKTVDASNRVYLLVALSINPFSAFVTLILPSALILLADLVSFALPFEGGERNSFKVTLVLSFTMFLLILSDHLPNSGHCSPLLHYHFSFCLVCLVMSMLASIVLTRLSVEDSFLVCRRSTKVHPSSSSKTNDGLNQEKGIR